MSALAGLVDKGLVAPDWAAGAGAGRRPDRRDGAVPARRAGGRAALPARPATAILRAFQRPAGRRTGAGRRPGPLPHARPPDRAELRGRPRTCGRCRRSLRNIYTELRDDLGVEPPAHGDLTAWADQGVMLLNRVLTVRPGRVGQPPRPRLGGGHRARDRRARRARRPVRRDPVGPRRPVAQAAARPDPVGRVRAPLAAVGAPRLLRVAARSAGSTGCSRSRAARRSTGRLPTGIKLNLNY